MPSFHPRIAAVAALLVLSAGLSGCGGSSDDDPSTSPSVSPSSAPTSAAPSPTKPPKAKPLSRFEKRPQVKVTREWAVAYARDVNAGHYQLPRSAAFETDHGRTVVPNIDKSDMGLHFPGPLPYTPVAVSGSGASAQVTVCLWEQGWGEKHGKPAGRKKIGPAVFLMKKVGGHWRIDDLQVATADCSGIKVRGVRW
jgi:hypothetical protein